MTNLSDYDRMFSVRLPHWGRWSRENNNRPNPDAVTAAIYRMGKSPATGVMVSWRCSKCQREDSEPTKCRECGIFPRRVEERVPDDPPRPKPDDPHGDPIWITWLIGTDDPRGMPGKIAMEHRHVLAGYFYRMNGSYHHRVPAAIRALLDAEEANSGRAA